MWWQVPIFWLFTMLHQMMELFVAVTIGYTFRAQPFNVLFQQAREPTVCIASPPRSLSRALLSCSQVQQVATELAEQMLPSITTIQLKPEVPPRCLGHDLGAMPPPRSLPNLAGALWSRPHCVAAEHGARRRPNVRALLCGCGG